MGRWAKSFHGGFSTVQEKGVFLGKQKLENELYNKHYYGKIISLFQK